MRTTIELPEEQRAELLRIAALEGQKGYSGIIQQAIQLYLEQRARRAEPASVALLLKGALVGPDHDTFAREALAARQKWR
ncbi:MAG: hypothetical protein HS115_03075 [Spirochaetales bacterium]|nr:hypothetical protein [Spirochaetales bacterium]